MTTALTTANGKAALLSNPQKPPAAIVDPSQIPDGLKMFDRFTGWNWEWKESQNAWTKPPKDAKTGCAGSSTNPNKWCSFDQAIEAQQVGRVENIGFVLGEADGGIHFAGIDLDDCRDPETGELSELAKEIIAAMDTYTEVSPSGTGIKIFFIGKLPEGHKTKNRAGTVEVYSRGRYFTLTGQQIDGTPNRVEQRQEQLEVVWQKYIGIEQSSTSDAEEKTPQPAEPADRAAVGVHQECLASMFIITKNLQDTNDGSKRLYTVCYRAV